MADWMPLFVYLSGLFPLLYVAGRFWPNEVTPAMAAVLWPVAVPVFPVLALGVLVFRLGMKRGKGVKSG